MRRRRGGRRRRDRRRSRCFCRQNNNNNNRGLFLVAALSSKILHYHFIKHMKLKTRSWFIPITFTMLDLNLSVSSLHNHHHDLLELSSTHIDASTSFNSSSNTAADHYSCSNAQPFSYAFSILNHDHVKSLHDDDDHVEDPTIQLFPPLDGHSSASITPQLLDLDCREMVPQVQQRPHVKKSRRGPRSRSSQYRGVTFYRRTGRWESHIWLVHS